MHARKLEKLAISVLQVPSDGLFSVFGNAGMHKMPRGFLGGGVPWGLWNPYLIPDHVQLILQPYTKLDTKNPYPILDWLLLELYKY